MTTLIIPALFIRALKEFFFSSLRANIRVLGLKSTSKKPSLVRIAQTESRFDYGLLMMA